MPRAIEEGSPGPHRLGPTSRIGIVLALLAILTAGLYFYLRSLAAPPPPVPAPAGPAVAPPATRSLPSQ